MPGTMKCQIIKIWLLVVLNLCQNEHLPTVVPTAVRCSWTFPRAKKCPPDTFCTSLWAGAALSSPVSLSKKSNTEWCWTFLSLLPNLDISQYYFMQNTPQINLFCGIFQTFSFDRFFRFFKILSTNSNPSMRQIDSSLLRSIIMSIFHRKDNLFFHA